MSDIKNGTSNIKKALYIYGGYYSLSNTVRREVGIGDFDGDSVSYGFITGKKIVRFNNVRYTLLSKRELKMSVRKQVKIKRKG